MDPRAERMVDSGLEEAKVTFDLGEDASEEEVAAMMKKLGLEDESEDESES